MASVSVVLSESAIRLLRCYCQRADSRHGVSYAGPTYYAAQCHCSNRTILRAKAELVAAGTVRNVERGEPGTDGIPDGVRSAIVKVVDWERSWIGPPKSVPCHTNSASYAGAPTAKEREAQRDIRQTAIMSAMTYAVSKVGQRLTKRQAEELLPVVQATVENHSVFRALAKLAFIFRKQTIRKSVYGWWLRAVERWRQYHRGKDEGEVREVEHRREHHTGRGVNAEAEPPPTRSELEQIADDYREAGDLRRAMAVAQVVNGTTSVTSNLMAKVRALRDE